MGRMILDRLGLLAVLAGGAMPLAAAAQSIGYGNLAGGDDVSASGHGESSDRSARRGSGARTTVTPYIEAAQIVQKELSPGDDVLTYSSVAAGIDAGINGRNTGGSLSLRYEHRFGWGKKADDSDNVSGVARGYARVAPGVQIDAGGMAARTRIESSGDAILGPLADGDAVSQVYSVYAGPSISTHVGDVAINADYHAGYTRVESPHALAVAPGQQRADVFDDSVAQAASVHAGVKPYDVLPIGIGAGASYYREDMSNLDQRVENFAARGDITVPIDTDLALVGGAGYEDVKISMRDALRDASGAPVIGKGGRYVTDKSGPRLIAYDTSGLIWDAGVIWRPSRRTSFEAHVGRRYGSTSVYGSMGWAPSARSSLSVSVYDNVAGFGGQMYQSLASLPDEFQAVRNPLTGDIGGCVASVQQDGSGPNSPCLNGALGSVRSSAFRSRGVMASYSLDLGSLQTGIGGGYDRRRYFAARGTVLAMANGVIDEKYWLAAWLGGRIDSESSFSTNLYANWFQTGSGLGGDTTALGASAAYNRHLTRGLTATAAVGIDGVNRAAPLDDDWIASALLGVRYSF